jgi:hypothetical protein
VSISLIPLVLAIASGAFTLWRLWRTRDLAGAATLAAVLLPALLWRLVPLVSELTHHRINEEDGLVEWATAWAFLFAAILFGARAFQSVPSRWVSLAFGALGLLCVFVAGEEISWGQRLLALAPPAEFLAHNHQLETNLHNLSRGVPIAGVAFDATDFGAFFALAYGGVLPFGRAWLLRRRSPLWRALGEATPQPLLSPAYLAVPAILFNYTLDTGAELAELVLGLCFVATATALRRGTRGGRTAAFVAASLTLGALMPSLIDHATAGDDSRRAKAEAELEALREDFAAGRAELSRGLLFTNQAHHRLAHVVKRQGVTFAEGSGFLHAVEESRSPAGSLGEAFLDPWHNPYWLAWNRNSQRLFLYSFGPNRRRDGEYTALQKAAGDDVVVVLNGKTWTQRLLR